MSDDIRLDDLEAIDLASQLMIPTEEKTPAAAKLNSIPEPEKTEVKPDEKKETAEPVQLNEIISPEDSSEYLVNGIDAILSIVGGAYYSIKAYKILTPEQKKIVSEAKKKPDSQRTDDEKYLIEFLKVEKARIESKSDALDLNEKEIAKLKKTSKGMIKMKNWKIGPEFAFWVTLADILSDRAIDAFMD